MIDAVGNPQSILLLGGTSEIGLATVEAFASDRPLRVVLAGRPSTAARRGQGAARGRGAARWRRSRSTPGRGMLEVIAKAFAGGDIDVALVAFGLLGDNEKAGPDVATAVELAQVNYTAAVAVGVALGERMTAQGHGSIVAFSSVAGERARRSNFVYGSTKAGLDAFYSGSRRRCARSGCTSRSCGPGSCTPG